MPTPCDFVLKQEEAHSSITALFCLKIGQLSINNQIPAILVETRPSTSRDLIAGLDCIYSTINECIQLGDEALRRPPKGAHKFPLGPKNSAARLSCKTRRLVKIQFEGPNAVEEHPENDTDLAANQILSEERTDDL